MKRLRTFFLAFALALALGLGQHAAALHALGHASHALGQNDSTPAPSKCSEHSLFSSIGAALGATAPVAPYVAAIGPSALAPQPTSATLAPPSYFLSRAPPVSPA